MTQTPETSVVFSTYVTDHKWRGSCRREGGGRRQDLPDRSERRSHNLGKARMIANDRAHAHTSTERWNTQILPIYNHKLHGPGPTTHVPGDKNTSTSRAPGPAVFLVHLLKSETNVSRVATAWARKLIQLNTKTVWRCNNRAIGNPNYQREDCFPPG